MTGDIRSILIASEAVASLRMEAKIAEAFAKSGWYVKRSAYYTDSDTGKIREVDVLASGIFNRPQRRKGTGAPLINFDVFCECKNLSGTNLIFESSPVPKSQSEIQSYWVGYDFELRAIASAIARDANTKEPAQLQALYEYVVSRAYPHDGLALRHSVVVPAPPIDLTSRAYRETKGGKMPDENLAEGKKSNPSWNAVLSTLSSIRAAQARTRESVLSYLNTEDIKYLGLDNFIESISFFLDAQLMRYVFFHPFIVLNARLWNLEKEDLHEIGSARLFINNINGSDAYVDFVSESRAEEYIQVLTAHFAAAAKKSVSRLWEKLDAIEWEPGQAAEQLAKAIRPPA